MVAASNCILLGTPQLALLEALCQVLLAQVRGIQLTGLRLQRQQSLRLDGTSAYLTKKFCTSLIQLNALFNI